MIKKIEVFRILEQSKNDGFVLFNQVLIKIVSKFKNLCFVLKKTLKLLDLNDYF